MRRLLLLGLSLGLCVGCSDSFVSPPPLDLRKAPYDFATFGARRDAGETPDLAPITFPDLSGVQVDASVPVVDLSMPNLPHDFAVPVLPDLTSTPLPNLSPPADQGK